MDERSLKLYREALIDGKEKVHNIRVMVVGHYGVGKTTLVQRLLGQDVNISERTSTEGIDIHVHCVDVSLTSQEWTVQEKDAEKYKTLQRLMKLLNEKAQITEDLEKTERTPGACASTSPDDKKVDFSPHHKESSEEVVPDESEKNDLEMEILKLLVKNADKLERVIEDKAGLSMWDFAGQFAYYTTHQTFLTSRAVYLLVIDLSKQITDLVKDDCFLDREGIKLCKVHDLVEVWLNSIHTCSPPPEAGIPPVPPVILVGTHADKIPQNQRQQVSESIFTQIRYLLRDKPCRFHLTDDDFVIDNTHLDPKLEELKRKIVELASQQPFWGEEVPTRWLHLEQVLMKLKANDMKVIPYSLVESLNKKGTIQIETKEELDMFLQYLHEMGTILYFNTVKLRENVILYPQWLIDALSSLITPKTPVKNQAIIGKWYEFKDQGKLTQELIDAVWTESKNPEFHYYKELILLLMEQLNIVARPRSLSENGDEVKEENYWIAPCMLRQETPRHVITPEPNDERESTSVLSYLFKEKYLPPPIFHRLVAACVAYWPIAKQNSENQIFCGGCVFDLDRSHRLYLHVKEYIIFARITRMGIRERSPNAKVCSKVREFITEKLYEILGCLRQGLEFELCIQCSRSDGDSLDQVVPLFELQNNAELTCHSHENSHVIISRDLLKFWFADEICSSDLQVGTLHQTVLNRCLPALLRDLDVSAVSIYIQQKELFDDVTMRDILEERKTSDKIRELIKHIQQRDQDTYEKFKECLVLAGQPDLKDLLEEEEAKCGIDFKDKHEDQSADWLLSHLAIMSNSLNSGDETQLKELHTDTTRSDAETHLKEFDTGSTNQDEETTPKVFDTRSTVIVGSFDGTISGSTNQDEETTPKVFDTGSTVIMGSFDGTISGSINQDEETTPKVFDTGSTVIMAEISMPERLGPEGISNPSSFLPAVSRSEESDSSVSDEETHLKLI